MMISKAIRVTLLSLFIIAPVAVFSEWGYCGREGDLMRDLMIVEKINQSLDERMPVFYNHLLQGGYFNMPSARMGTEGEIGVGYSYVSPYSNYNLRFQFLDRLEISGNYRVFRGIEDAILSPSGFGDKSDKGANIKLAIMHPEDSDYCLPGLAVGYEDFMGTKGFEAQYVVLTQVFPRWDFELSLGYGKLRIRRWFGGLMWVPFRKSCYTYLQDLAFVTEYDAIPYKSRKREPHPDGRSKDSAINFGVKYRFWNHFDFSLSYNKGEKLAFAASTFYNFGLTQGVIPKINDSLPYKSPVNTEPLGPLRPNDVLVQDLLYPLREQGFTLQETWLSCDSCGNKILRLKILNEAYRYEKEVKDRLNALLANLIPADISEVIVVIEDRGIPIQEYRFSMDFVRLYADKKVCPYELYLLSPL
ncbi:MAG: YjbH domain-containing protein, partial [Waddliaceae bacterium]